MTLEVASTASGISCMRGGRERFARPWGREERLACVSIYSACFFVFFGGRPLLQTAYGVRGDSTDVSPEAPRCGE